MSLLVPEIEVTSHIDASRIIRVKAYIPMLDEEFEAVVDYNTASPDAKRLRQELDSELHARRLYKR